MSKGKSKRMFWRACGFLAPYRSRVIVSVMCAILTGAFTAGGLATLVPLLNVLIDGRTFSQFVDERVAERVADIKLSWADQSYTIEKVQDVGSRFRKGDVLDRATVSSLASDPGVGWHWRFARSIAARVPEDPLHAIATLFGFVFILAVCGSTTRFLQEFVSDVCAISSINDIRRKLYDHTLHLPMSYFTRHGTGDLTSRLSGDTMGLQEGFKAVLGRAIQEPITASFALLVAVWIEWRLTIIVILFTPIMVVIIRKLGTKVRRAMRATLQHNSELLGQIEATLIGVRVVKSATAEPHERRRYRDIVRVLLREQIRTARYEAWSTPALELLGMAAAGCVLIYASYLVFRDKSLDPPQLTTLMICLVAIAEPLRRISKLNATLQKSNAAAARIFEVLDTPGEASELRTLPTIAAQRRDLAFTRDIAFTDISFAYPGTTTTALNNVSLTVQRGQSVAIVGRNGSGKTTLLSLLPRFFEPSSGSVLIDGVDVRHWPIRRLRRMIGIVTQETIIFPGTIGQNIAYAMRRTPTEIEAAARRAYAHEFILEKPLGYDTPLGGLGSQLSGGQKQRLAIARAIMRDTPILILDEATSQVDAQSEHLIQQAISELLKDRTTFIIAHRFSTILNADKIVVMDAGQIVGQGRHDELMQSNAIYRELYERQALQG